MAEFCDEAPIVGYQMEKYGHDLFPKTPAKVANDEKIGGSLMSILHM